jgi:hypothetical protein
LAASSVCRSHRHFVSAPGLRFFGSPYILPPATPKEQVKILQNAMVKVFKDAEFYKEYPKFVGEEPTLAHFPSTSSRSSDDRYNYHREQGKANKERNGGIHTQERPPCRARGAWRSLRTGCARRSFGAGSSSLTFRTLRSTLPFFPFLNLDIDVSIARLAFGRLLSTLFGGILGSGYCRCSESKKQH